MKMIPFYLVLLFMISCAHHRDVRPGANGVHTVIVKGPDSSGLERSAINQAEHFCQERYARHAAFHSEKTQYQGEMDEGTRKTLRQASTAAMVLGGGASVNSSTRKGGSALGSLGTIGHLMTNGDDYVVKAQFACQ